MSPKANKVLHIIPHMYHVMKCKKQFLIPKTLLALGLVP
jgi:hypothetical protein